MSATRGETLKDFVIVALQQRISAMTSKPSAQLAPPWMEFAGQLADQKGVVDAIEQDIDTTFSVIDDAAWV